VHLTQTYVHLYVLEHAIETSLVSRRITEAVATSDLCESDALQGAASVTFLFSVTDFINYFNDVVLLTELSGRSGPARVCCCCSCEDWLSAKIGRLPDMLAFRHRSTFLC
jgi:hypothetical protein